MAGTAIKLENLKVALVHDWITGMRGGEKVLEMFCDIFPQADIYTLLWIQGSVSKKIESHSIKTSFLQKLPFVEKKYRNYLPLMPLAIESMKLSGYDLVISTNHCAAKGIHKPAGAKHLCYCFTPMRYIWDQYNEYFNPQKAGLLTRTLMRVVRPFLQHWDVRTAKKVDRFVAISDYISERIKTCYNLSSDMIFPPVNVLNYPESWDGGYFLIVSALVPYKKVDLAIKAFNISGLPLKIIGSGPETWKLKEISEKNIEFLGWQTDEQIRHYYAGCKAFIFPQEEDFGITAVEAQVCGKPVIAYAKGGALETVIEGETGTYFHEPTADSLNSAVSLCLKTSFSEEKIRKNALRFSEERFIKEITEYIKSFMESK